MKRVLLHIVFFTLLLFGCAPGGYIPIGSVQNVPLITDSTAARFSLNFGSGGFSPSFAGVFNHQNVMMMNLSFFSEHKDTYTESSKITNRFLIEMAWGRFRYKHEDKVLEWFVGGGFGNSNVQANKYRFSRGWDASPIGVHEKAKFIQPFVQFDYGEPDEKNEIAYSIKMVVPYYLSYSHVQIPQNGGGISNYDNSWTIFLQEGVSNILRGNSK
jgi:hypothetical protein